jgi:hypothetical protein
MNKLFDRLISLGPLFISLAGFIFWGWNFRELFVFYVIDAMMITLLSVMMILIKPAKEYGTKAWLFKLGLSLYLIVFNGIFLTGFAFTILSFFPKPPLQFSWPLVIGLSFMHHSFLFLRLMQKMKIDFLESFIQVPTYKLFFLFIVLALGTQFYHFFHSTLVFPILLVLIKTFLDTTVFFSLRDFAKSRVK